MLEPAANQNAHGSTVFDPPVSESAVLIRTGCDALGRFQLVRFSFAKIAGVLRPRAEQIAGYYNPNPAAPAPAPSRRPSRSFIRTTK